MTTIRRAVVDSSPLMNLLGLHFNRMSEGPKHNLDRIITGNAERYLRAEPDSQKRFLELFDGIDQILISSHVIGELQGLSHALKLDPPARRAFWQHSADYLRQRKLDETTIRLLELDDSVEDRASIGIIGPTDTGLIRLAQSEGCPLLTDDENTLYREALRIGVDCRLVKNLVYNAGT